MNISHWSLFEADRLRKSPKRKPTSDGPLSCPACNGDVVYHQAYFCHICHTFGHLDCVTSVRIWTVGRSGSVYPLGGHICAACMEID